MKIDPRGKKNVEMASLAASHKSAVETSRGKEHSRMIALDKHRLVAEHDRSV